MFGNPSSRRIGGSLLFGGLVCLALAAPTAAHASPSIIPMEKVQPLEEAVRRADRSTILNLLADTPDNRGREELLAFLDEHEAAGTLEYVMQERFGEVAETKWLLADHFMEVADVTFDSDGRELTYARLKLKVALKEQDGSVQTREVAGYMNVHDWRLVLPDGLLPFSTKESQLTTDLLQYRTKLLNKTTEQVAQGKFQSRAEVAQAITDDLWQAEPMKQYMAQIVFPAVGKTLGKAVAEAFNEAFKEALKKAVLKPAQP